MIRDARFYYEYDELDRLSQSKYHTGSSHTGQLDETIAYDNMGNIQNLARGSYGSQNYTYSGTFGYAYTGNRLDAVTNNSASYRSYAYDANGNVTGDGTLGFEYNALDLPRYVKQGSTPVITYTYTATGQKLKKASGQTGVTDYVSGIQYSGNGASIELIQTEEGRYDYGSSKYQYNLTDHLGNVRAMIEDGSSGATVVQENEYYAFGLSVNRTNVSPANKYLYNNKELQDDYDLNQYDYGARFYDPVVGRFNMMDPNSDSYHAISPYNYVFNNPLSFIDPTGMDPNDPPGWLKGVSTSLDLG